MKTGKALDMALAPYGLGIGGAKSRLFLRQHSEQRRERTLWWQTSLSEQAVLCGGVCDAYFECMHEAGFETLCEAILSLMQL